MTKFNYKSIFPWNVQKVFNYRIANGALSRLTPPWQRVKILAQTGQVPQNGILSLSIKEHFLPPIKANFQFRKYEENKGYISEQAKGLLKGFTHQRIFTELTENSSTLEDKISYTLPLGRLGEKLNNWEVKQNLMDKFAFRHARQHMDMTRLNKYNLKPLKIAISGTSGLIGSELISFLTIAGHKIKPMVRSKQANRNKGEVCFDPDNKVLDMHTLQGTDVIIHLAGEPITKRWTNKQKAYLLSSRINSIKMLCNTAAKMKEKPKTIIIASATGYYGNTEALCDEDSPAGDNFPAKLCKAMEDATKKASSYGIRVVFLRLGVVISNRGGIISKMKFPHMAGLGATLGDGNQPISWISMEDTIGAIYHILATETIKGAINITSPNPISNAEFTQHLALNYPVGKLMNKTWSRATFFKLPNLFVSKIFGEMGDELLLKGIKVKPKKLEDSGFNFFLPLLDEALGWELKGKAPTKFINHAPEITVIEG